MDRGTAPLLAVESWTLTTATVPLLTVLLFMPLAKQVSDPVPELQVTVLPAAVKAAPAETLTAAMLPEAYDNVHCIADGALPAAAFKDRLRVATFP